MRKWTRRLTPAVLVLAAAAAAALATTTRAAGPPPPGPAAATPIEHVVVIFQENVSFDHYFGTYPFATNADGQPFTAAQGTPDVSGLTWSLLAANPNLSNPKRLDSSPSGLAGSPGGQLTCDSSCKVQQGACVDTPIDWYDVAWHHRRTVTVQHAQVAADLTDFRINLYSFGKRSCKCVFWQKGT